MAKYNIDSNNSGWVIALILGIILILMMWLGCNTTNKDNCPTITIKDSTIICCRLECDTVSYYYYNKCSNCLIYEKDSASIYICGGFTRTLIKKK